MAIALTLQNTFIHTDGNKVSKCYLATLTSTYPAGGYVVNNSVYPDATNVFAKIHRVGFTFGQFDADGNLYMISDLSNTDETNPSFKLRAFQFETGGGAPVEVGTGAALASTIYLTIEGVKAGGVISDTV